MSDSLDDSLSRRLSSLESDLGGVSLPGPAAARRRAAQRTRNQVTGGVLAGVAAVALGVFAVSPPDFVASPDPAGTPTDSSTPTTTPTTPSPEPTTPPPTTPPTSDPTSDESPDGDGEDGGEVVIPAAALMLPEDFRNENSWTPASSPNDPILCVPEAPGPDARGSARADFTGRDFDIATQFIEVAPPGTAADRLDQLRSEAQECLDEATDDETQLVTIWNVAGAGDETWVMSYITPTTLQEESVLNIIVGLSRTGDVVSMVAEAQPTNEYYGIGDWESAAGAIGRICTAMLGESCADEPQAERIYPEVPGDVDGWLTVDDLAEVGLGALTDGGDVLDDTDEGGPIDYGFVGFNRDPFADGAESLAQRDYTDPQELGGRIVFQRRATFPDAASARAHYDALAAAAEQPTQPGDVVENTGTVSGDGYDGTSWQLTNTEYGTSWLYGAAVSGNVVTAVYYGLIDDELTPDQMRQLIDLAAQRIGG